MLNWENRPCNNDHCGCCRLWNYCSVSEHLCGTLQFPSSQLLLTVKNDKRLLNRKQIAPELQIIISCDVKEKKKPHSKLCLCFTEFLCIVLSRSFSSRSLNHSSCGKSVPAVTTLIWLENVSIKLRHVAQNLILVTRYFSSHWALC